MIPSKKELVNRILKVAKEAGIPQDERLAEDIAEYLAESHEDVDIESVLRSANEEEGD